MSEYPRLVDEYARFLQASDEEKAAAVLAGVDARAFYLTADDVRNLRAQLNTQPELQPEARLQVQAEGHLLVEPQCEPQCDVEDQ